MSSEGNVLALTLLKVCSQINAEAALLPYSLNTFFFCGILSLDLFVQDVPMSAVQAIRRLMFTRAMDEKGSFRAFAWYILPFEGLQEVALRRSEILELPGYYPEGTEAKLSKKLTELKTEMPNFKVFLLDEFRTECGIEYC